MTKRAEAIKALRDMTDDELIEHVRQQRRRLFELRFQQATGQVENHRQLRDVRREIARGLTMQVELARASAASESDDG
jgi:large subunit ribosomal protein L29